MNFLVDAHLPRRVVYRLREAGHNALHTLDLPQQNRTSDQGILQVAQSEARVVVTKDADFVASHIIQGVPEKLLLISTGNINNAGLESLLMQHLSEIVTSLESFRFVELTRTTLIIH